MSDAGRSHGSASSTTTQIRSSSGSTTTWLSPLLIARTTRQTRRTSTRRLAEALAWTWRARSHLGTRSQVHQPTRNSLGGTCHAQSRRCLRSTCTCTPCTTTRLHAEPGERLTRLGSPSSGAARTPSMRVATSAPPLPRRKPSPWTGRLGRSAWRRTGSTLRSSSPTAR